MINDYTIGDDAGLADARNPWSIVVHMRYDTLSFGSCMAPNADGFVADLVKELQACTGFAVNPVGDPWPEREARLDRGEIELGWICGLPYVWKADIAAAAIDSTVLETELANRPSLANQIRIIEVLGPSPIPPVVASKGPPESIFTAMHEIQSGQAVFSKHRNSHFQGVQDSFYDRVREMAHLANRVTFSPVS